MHWKPSACFGLHVDTVPMVYQRACTLLEHLYVIYRDDNNPSKATAAALSSTSTESIFMDTILSMTPDQQQALVMGLEDYVRGTPLDLSSFLLLTLFYFYSLLSDF
jgi:hypothetical protein